MTDEGDVEEVATLNEPFFSEAPWRYSGLLRVGEIIKDSWASEHCAKMTPTARTPGAAMQRFRQRQHNLLLG